MSASAQVKKATTWRFQPAKSTYSPPPNNNESSNGEWQQVTSRRHRAQAAKRFVQRKPRFSSQKVQNVFNQAIKARKCFRCLAVGHQRAQCREPPRCFNCHKLGHYSARCKAAIKPLPNLHKEKEIVNIKPISAQGKTFAQTVAGCPKMENFDEEFLDERPEEVDVFFPVSSELRPANSYLDSAAYISFLRGGSSRDLPWAIKQTMVHLHGGFTENYQVHKLDGEVYLLVCANQSIRNRIVQQGPYEIPIAGVRIKMEKWTNTTGMTFWPNEYQAWVKVVGLPLGLWNDEDLHRAMARVGSVKYVMPYGIQAGQLEHICLYMDTKHLRHLPQNLRVRIGNFTKRVRVILLGWRVAQEGYFPPPIPPNRSQPSTVRYAPYNHNQGHRRTALTPQPTPQAYSESESSGASNGQRWASTHKPLISQAKARRETNIWVPKQAVAPPPVLCKIMVKEPTLEKDHRWVLVQATQTEQNKQMCRGSQRIDTPKVTLISSVVRATHMAAKISAEKITSIVWQLDVALVMCGERVGFKLTNILSRWNCTFHSHYLTTIVHMETHNLSGGGTEVKKKKDGLQLDIVGSLELTQLAGPEPIEHKSNGPDEAQSPDYPPGFEPWVVTKLAQANGSERVCKPPIEQPSRVARRSPRLKEKRNGPYVPILEKAMAIKGKGPVDSPPRRTPRRAVAPTNLDYFKTVDPLSQAQAELVVLVAGIENTQAMTEKIDQVVKAGKELEEGVKVSETDQTVGAELSKEDDSSLGETQNPASSGQ